MVRQARAQDPGEAADLACALVCSRCGRLDWPASTAHPLRRDDDRGTGACPHCGDDAWLDLGQAATALALREREEGDAYAADTHRRELTLNLSVGTVLGTVIGLVTVGVGWPALLVGLGTGAIAGLYKHREQSRGAAEPTDLPRRWAMTLPPTGEPDTTVHGPLVLTDEPLRSPFTAERCAAWEIGLRDDEDDDGAPATWTLLEQRLGAGRVGEQDVLPDRTHLRLRRRRLGRISQLELEPSAVDFLRQRGFTPGDTDLVAYETVIPVDAEVVLARRTGGDVLTLPVGGLPARSS
jgi:hypothetical protein